MTYNKPEIRVLGEAASVIMSRKPMNSGIDGSHTYTNTPAYELDE